MNIVEKLGLKLLHKTDPENAHNLAIKALKYGMILHFHKKAISNHAYLGSMKITVQSIDLVLIMKAWKSLQIVYQSAQLKV